MKKFLLSLAVIALCSGDVCAGPVRNLFENVRERRDARHHKTTCIPTPVTVVQPVATVPQPTGIVQPTFGVTVGGGCANGSCPAPARTFTGFRR